MYTQYVVMLGLEFIVLEQMNVFAIYCARCDIDDVTIPDVWCIGDKHCVRCTTLSVSEKYDLDSEN